MNPSFYISLSLLFFWIASFPLYGMDLRREEKLTITVPHPKPMDVKEKPSNAAPYPKSMDIKEELPPYHNKKYLFSSPQLDIFSILVAFSEKKISKDEVEKLLLPASQKGDEIAQQQLYKYYTTGNPVGLKNPLKAGKLLTLAAEQGKTWAYKEKAETEPTVEKQLSWHKRLEKRGKDASTLFIYKKLKQYTRILVEPREAVKRMVSPTLTIDKGYFSSFIKACKEINFTGPILNALRILEARLGSHPSEKERLVYQQLWERLTKEGAELGNAICMYNYGLQCEANNNEKDMLFFLKRAASEEFLLARVKLTDVYFSKGNNTEAFAWGEKAAEAGNLGAMETCGGIFEAKGQTSKAKKDFLKAYQYFYEAGKEGNQRALFKAGICLAYSGEHKKSLEVFEPLGHMGMAEGAANAGVQHERLENYSEAIKWYKKALQLGYSNFGRSGPELIYSELWKLYIRQEKFDKALKYFQLEHKLSDLDAKRHFFKVLADNGHPFEGLAFLLEAASDGHPVVILGMIIEGMLSENIEDVLFWLHKGLSLEGEDQKPFIEIEKRIDLYSETPLDDFKKWLEELQKPLHPPLQPSLHAPREKENASINLPPLPPSVIEILPESAPSKEEVSSEKKAVNFSDKKEGQLNEKGQRELLRQIYEQKKLQLSVSSMEQRSLDTKEQKIANQILQGDTTKLDVGDFITLFSDPYFQRQVTLRKNEAGAGFIIAAHHRTKKQSLTTGTHHVHGKEKFVGKVHPKIFKIVKEILVLFDVKEK